MPANKDAAIRYRIIDKLIRNKFSKFPNIEDIMEACEEVTGKKVSKSSIEKDIKAMKMDEGLAYFAPIKFDRSYKGYYYEDPEYSINGIDLSEDDISAIQFAMEILNQFKCVEAISQFENAIDKIKAFVDFKLINEEDYKDIIQMEYVPFVKGRDLIQEITPAIKNKYLIEFDYQSRQSSLRGVIKRAVLPYILKEYQNRWYLTGYYNDKDIRTFALDRIENLEITNKKHINAPEFNSSEYFKYSFGITTPNNTRPKKFTYSFNPSQKHYLESQPLHHSQQVTIDNKEEFRISIEVYPCEELDRAIRSYGDLVKVI